MTRRDSIVVALGAGMVAGAIAHWLLTALLAHALGACNP